MRSSSRCIALYRLALRSLAWALEPLRSKVESLPLSRLCDLGQVIETHTKLQLLYVYHGIPMETTP